MSATAWCEISSLGIATTMQMLLELSVQAGQFVRVMQERVCRAPQGPEQKSGSSFAAALTDADIAAETMIAARVMSWFRDASFYGEEAAQDRVSAYFAKDLPFVITADPINGTRYYMDGLKHYEVIITLCDKQREMVGAVICMPAKGLVFVATDIKGIRQVQKYRISEQDGRLWPLEPYRTEQSLESNIIMLGDDFAHRVDELRGHGLRPVISSREYTGQADWGFTSADVLNGNVRGGLGRECQLIDAGAVGFATSCGGGVWKHGPLDLESMRHSYCLFAADEKTAQLLESFL